MIEESRYARMVYHMGKDIRYLVENFEQYKTAMKTLFGDVKAKDIENRLQLIYANQRELAEDLKDNKFYRISQEVDQLRKENEKLKEELQLELQCREQARHDPA